MRLYERPNERFGNLPARVGHARRLAAPQPVSTNTTPNTNPEPGVESSSIGPQTSRIQSGRTYAAALPNNRGTIPPPYNVSSNETIVIVPFIART